MPSRMVLNTGRVVGYKNKLKQAVPGKKLGANNDVNQGTNKAALHLMEGGPSEVNPPNSQHSNPIHKANIPVKTKPKLTISQPQKQEGTKPTTDLETELTPPAGSGNEAHDVNKIIVAVGAVAVVGVMFLSLLYCCFLT